MKEFFGGFISCYSRAQALEDGNLVDVSATAREAGFTVPVAVTRALWDRYITPDPALVGWGQSEAGRLWDTLFVLRMFIKMGKVRGEGPQPFTVGFQMPGRTKTGRLKRDGSPMLAEPTLWVDSGPGDDGEHVITVMLPEDL
jgi:hypothetical protein